MCACVCVHVRRPLTEVMSVIHFDKFAKLSGFVMSYTTTTPWGRKNQNTCGEERKREGLGGVRERGTELQLERERNAQHGRGRNALPGRPRSRLTLAPL